MTQTVSTTDRIRAYLVLAATVGTVGFNWLAANGHVGGVTPELISDKFPSVITPSAYAFTIWTLIYAGLIVFSIYQLLPGQIERFRPIRSLYIFASALNCAWIFFWAGEQIAICLVILVALTAILFLINSKLPEARSGLESFLVRGTYGLYLGWVSAAALINFAVFLVYIKADPGSARPVLGAALVLIAAAFGVFIRVCLVNYFAPLAIAWALTAIAVKQSGNTLVVAAAAVGVIACLIAATSFVLNLKSSLDE